jgi:hypothetical protein
MEEEEEEEEEEEKSASALIKVLLGKVLRIGTLDM